MYYVFLTSFCYFSNDFRKHGDYCKSKQYFASDSVCDYDPNPNNDWFFRQMASVDGKRVLCFCYQIKEIRLTYTDLIQDDDALSRVIPKCPLH